METKSNIVKVECIHFWSDWTDITIKEIDVDEYASFTIDYRSRGSWHIIGNKIDSERNWTHTELSDHQVNGVRAMAEFIKNVNSLYDGHNCKISKFVNYHHSSDFYDSLRYLLELVDKEE